jgi:hypothetical protein
VPRAPCSSCSFLPALACRQLLHELSSPLRNEHGSGSSLPDMSFPGPRHHTQVTRVQVGDTDIEAFHLPVDDPSPRLSQRTSSVSGGGPPGGSDSAFSSPAAANKYAVSNVITPAAPVQMRTMSSPVGPPHVPQTWPGMAAAHQHTRSYSNSPMVMTVPIHGVVQRSDSPVIMTPHGQPMVPQTISPHHQRSNSPVVVGRPSMVLRPSAQHNQLLISPTGTTPRVPMSVNAPPQRVHVTATREEDSPREPPSPAPASSAWQSATAPATLHVARPSITLVQPFHSPDSGRTPSPHPGGPARLSVTSPTLVHTSPSPSLQQMRTPSPSPPVHSPSPSPSPGAVAPKPPVPPPASQPAEPSTLHQRPTFARMGSLGAEEKMQELGLSKPVILRLQSIAPKEIELKKKQQEAAKPDLVKAERYRNLTCPRKRDTSKGTYSLYDIWKFTDREFLQYGLGVMLWFKLTRRMSYLFLVLFFLNLPSLVFNIAGPDGSSIAYLSNAYVADGSSSSSSSSIAASSNSTFLSNSTEPTSDPLKVRTGTVDGTYGLSKSTLAHQGLVYNATIMGYTKQQIGIVTGGLDTFSTLLFFVVVLWIFRDHAKEATAYNSTVMTVRRFTILVSNLPTTQPVLNRLHIADFFQSKFGPVVDVSVAYNDMHLIDLFRQRGEAKREAQTAEMQGDTDHRDALSKKVQQIDKTILFKRRIYKKEVRAAFVTFQNQESVAKALAAYPNTWWARCTMPRHLRFHLATIKVTRAAEPSNTLFQNLGLTYGDQWCRRAWTGLVSLAFMSVSFIAVFVSQYYQNRLPTTTSCATAPITTQAQVVDTQSRFCYCGGLPADQLYEQSSFCSQYLAQYAIAKGLIFMTAISTVLVNFLLQVFMDRLAVLERHSSITSQQRGVTSRLFWGLFFNTAVIILIVNANIAPYIGDLSFLSSLFPGKYSEFEPDWYYEVGVSVLITMFLNSMNPHLLSLLAIPYDRCRRERCHAKRRTQNELNQLFQGRTFVLYERYSVLLNTVFSCMLFSSGMPILWLVASFTFGLTYWFDRVTFLRSYKIPPRYDESLDAYAGKTMPWAIVPHCLLALWFFSSPTTNSFVVGDIVPLLDGVVIRTGVLSLKARLFQWNVFPTVCLLFLLASIYLVRRMLALIFFCRASEAEARSARIGQEEKKSKSRMVTYQEAATKIGLESYRLSRQVDYRTAYIATPSGKQLHQDLDLYELREQLKKGGKSSNAPVPVKKGHKKKQDSAAASSKQKGDSSQNPSSTPSGATSSSDKYAVASPPPDAPHGAPAAANTRPGHRPAQQAWGSTGGGGEIASITKTPGSASESRRSDPGERKSGEHSHLSDHDAALTATTIRITPSQRPLAPPTELNDNTVLQLAAAVADSTASAQSMGYTLLPIACASCANLFQIVDCGEAMSYTCPFCGVATII